MLSRMSSFDESVLVSISYLMESLSNTTGEDFGNDFVRGRDEANWPKVLYAMAPAFLGMRGD